MYRILAAFFLLVASVATSSAQGLLPAVWQNQQGSLLKVLASDPATGRPATWGGTVRRRLHQLWRDLPRRTL